MLQQIMHDLQQKRNKTMANAVYTTPRFNWIDERVSDWFLLATRLPSPRPRPKFAVKAFHVAQDDEMLMLTGALPSELRN